MTAVEAPSPTMASEGPPGAFSRFSDRLNPILVREVQQAIKGRVFPFTIMAALAICVVIVAVVAPEYVEGGDGRGAFEAGFATLLPLVMFVVPMQAYQSMRTELRGGIVEQLLLSRLSPGRILFGKLQAAMVQFVIYVSVMAPLLATSYLLRGVDLPTVAVSLAFALILCVAATAFAVSSAAQGVLPAMQPIANLGIAFGLGIATFGMVVTIGSGEYLRELGALMRSGEFLMVSSAIVGLAFVATVLSWLAARSFLLHAFENKSTGFRIFMFCAPVLAYGWLFLFVDPRHRDEGFLFLTVMLLVAGFIFGVFMVTEQQQLSPRVRAHVPRGSTAALLASPLLPGRDRGLLCFVLYATLLAVIAYLFWPTASGGFRARMFTSAAKGSAIGITYAAVYLSIGRWIRQRLPDTLQGNHHGRFLVPFAVFLGCVLPVLVDFFARGEVDSWHFGHVMNPFWTIGEFSGSRFNRAAPYVLTALIATLVLMLPTWRRGIVEVVRAAKARREREAAPVADSVE